MTVDTGTGKQIVEIPAHDRQTLESAVEEVPDDFLSERDRETLRRRRAAYVAFLWKRLKDPRPFVRTDVTSPG